MINTKKVDDKPFGGGRGMVLKIEPIIKAISKIKPACRRGRSENLKSEKF